MKHLVLSLLAASLCITAGAQSRVTSMSANSTKMNVALLQNTEQTVQLSRHLFAGYNTLCLPMSLSAEQVAAAAKDLRVERLVAVKQEGAVLNLCFVDCTAEGLQAGVPYLVYSPTTQYLRAKTDNVLYTDITLRPVRLSDSEGNQVSFGSSWETVKEEGRYGIPAQQSVTPLESVLIRTEADKAFLPTRCGFTWDAQSATARELKIQHFGSMSDVTAVTAVKGSQTAATDVYGLDGQKMGQKKGIAITGGKKVIVK